MLVKDVLAATLSNFMTERGDPHRRGLFASSISESGEPLFVGREFGCFYFRALDASPNVARALVHSLSGAEVQLPEASALPITTPILNNYNDFLAYFTLLGSKMSCAKLFSREGVEMCKLTRQEVCDKARDAVRKKREEVTKDSVTLDSSLQAIVKRKRPSVFPKANVVSPPRPPRPEVHSLSSPEQQEPLAGEQRAETQAADSQVDPEAANS